MKSTILNFRNQFLTTLVAFFIITATTNAQMVSPAVMQMAQSEIQKRGLNEAEVRTRLLQEGIDVDNISPTEIPQYQTRITNVLNKMVAEKKAGISTTKEETIEEEIQPIKPVFEKAKPDTIKPTQKQPEINIYGHSLFTDNTLVIYKTNDGSQAPDTYVLGEGDEIHITIFGSSQTDIQQRISSDGSIQPTGVAKIFLKGLTLSQAREVIKSRLSASYLFRNDQLAVTVVKVRTIMVNVFGEANKTGGYTLTALNSALNALSAAGGPTQLGSVRNIQVIRGNTRKNIDLYEFMNDPSIQSKFDLQNNDVVFVPVAKKLVSIEGAIKRPMMYEMLSEESLTDLIRYSGGLSINAYPEYVQIQRYIDGEELLMEWNLKEVRNGKVKVPLINGDIVRIKSINKPMDQYVGIQGSVYYPGRFDLSANTMLSTLLSNAKPNFRAKTDYLFVERMNPDSTKQILTVPFPGENGANDFRLQARDSVRVLDQATYRDIDTISVSGHVRLPFQRAMSFKDKITVNQAIEMAGGLKTSAYPVAYIFRRNIFNPKEVKYIRLELEKDGNVQLQSGDNLNIYDNSTYTNIGEVRIFGAVNNPKGYTFNPSMTIHDLIVNSGGFTVGAAYNRVEVFRTVLSPTEKVKLHLLTLEVDSSYNLINSDNFVLQPYDQVVVRMTPEFTLGRTVEITGQVEYPGTYVLESKKTRLSDILMSAGGLLDNYDPYGARLFRTYNNRGSISMDLRRANRNIGNNSYDPILFEGDVININRLENVVSIIQNGTRMAQYSNDTSLINDTTIGKVLTRDIKNIVFQGRRSAAWYIRNFAGGFHKNADRNSVTVTLPNNQMVSTKHILFLRNYPTVQSGSTISLQMDTKKMEKELEPKEKVDWERTLQTGLSTLMSTLSIILLLRSL